LIYRDVPYKYREFYVVFTDSIYIRPWHIFTVGRWKHCWVFSPAYMGPIGLLTPRLTIRLNPLSTYGDYDFWLGSPEEVSADFIKLEEVLDIVKITLPLIKDSSYNIRGLLNCVTLVKYILGLKCWWVMTPQQLHRRLLKLGGKSLK